MCHRLYHYLGITTHTIQCTILERFFLFLLSLEELVAPEQDPVACSPPSDHKRMCSLSGAKRRKILMATIVEVRLSMIWQFF